MSRAHELRLTPGAGGTILLENPRPLPAHAARIGDWLDHWAAHAPDRVFLAERSGDAWREITYRTAAQAVAGYAAGLLARGAEPGRPLLIITGNGVDHGLIALAAQRIGTPVVPVAEQYAALSAAHSQL
ncbi:MAG: AMP-binding protein, partial [Pseudomonadota bacterium]